MSERRTFEIRYVGSRFVGGRLPLEILSDLPAFRDLLMTFAKEKWHASNADRKRLPKGFGQSFTYDLIGIANGSAVARLERASFGQRSLPGLDQSEELAAESYEELVKLIDGAGSPQHPKNLSLKKVLALNRFGSGLKDGEKIEFNGSKGADGNVVYLDTYRMKALITQGRDTYQLRVDGIGILSSLHVDGFIGVRTDEYEELKIRVDPDRVKDEFNVTESLGAPVQFSLLIEFDAQDKYKSVKDVYEVELIDPDRSDSTMKCMEKLTELRQLEDGWLDGSGVRTTDAAIEAAELFISKRPELTSAFRICPMEAGGVAFEFEVGGWDYSIEFGPDGDVEMFGVEIDGADEMRPTSFIRVDDLFLAEFDLRTTK